MILYRYMKKKARKIGVILGILGILMTSPLMTQPAMAADEGSSCNKTLFGMRPWYYGLTDSNCNIKQPSGDEELTKYVWMIILNVTSDILVATGYLAMGFVIYGGYLYLLSGGDTGKVAKGKKTLTAAIIGLVIILLASVIVNFIIGIIA